VRLYLIPALGTTRLVALRSEQFDRLYLARRKAGSAPQMVLHLHRVLHTALEQAVRWGYVARNVAAQATPPKVPAHLDTEEGAGGVPTDAEVVALLDAAEEHGDRLLGLWQAAACTGLRLGESTGLRWGDILLPPVDESDGDGDPKGDGGVVLVRRTLQRVAAVRFHGLRHYAATSMLDGGETLPTVSRTLGHSKTSTTADVYAHIVQERLRLATSAIERRRRASRATRTGPTPTAQRGRLG
jgi:integrase